MDKDNKNNEVNNTPKNNKKEFFRVLKYTLIAASAGIIQIGSFALLHDVFMMTEWWLSYLPSLILSVLWNFTFNRKYTFKSASNVPVAMVKVAIYYVIFTPLSTVFGNWLVSSMGWDSYVVEILNMLINFVTEFLYQRFFVFRNSIDSAVPSSKIVADSNDAIIVNNDNE